MRESYQLIPSRQAVFCYAFVGEHEVFDSTLSSASQGDHFRDATKMVFRFVTRCFTRLNDALNGCHEVFPVGISQGLLQIAGEPDFDDSVTRKSLSQRIEVALHAVGLFDVHKLT
jgi:hypothetical protein